MRKKVTLKQIAKELDVSISTVSKSLRDSHEISEDTRLKVQAFAKLYNYKLIGLLSHPALLQNLRLDCLKYGR